MNLSPALRNSFITARQNLLRDNLPFICEEKLREGIEEELDEIIELSDLEKCQKGADFFDLPDMKAEHYQERLINIDSERAVLLGVRFRGLRIDECYVNTWANFEIKSEIEIEELKQVARREFACFHPKWISLSFAPDIDWAPMKYHIDLVTLVAEVSQLQKREVSDDEVYLELADNLDFYGQYSDEYKKFHLEKPHLKKEVTKETLADLEACAQDSLLYKVMKDNEMIGLMAARREAKYGENGVCIQEKFLFSGYRGLGLSDVFQTQFFQNLAADQEPIVWGTILHHNHGSLKSALRTGRRAVEADYFFDI